MSEWKEFTGSPEQIEEIQNSKHGFVARNTSSVSSIMSIKLNQLFISGQKNPYLPELFGNKVSEFLNYSNTTHYLICDPHPLEDMICQQARTGQDVFVHIAGTIYANYIAHRAAQDMDYFHSYYNKKLEATTYITKKPNWHIPGAQYSFTRFGGYRANK